MEKLAIDRKLLAQILEEENRTHDAAIRELEEKIANLEQQIKPSFTVEGIQSQTPSEPAQKMPKPAQEMFKPAQEVSDKVNEDFGIGALQERQEKARMLLQESDRTRVQSEVEAPQETKKKNRGLF